MTVIKKFTLKADQKFTECDPLSARCTGEVIATTRERTGELHLVLDKKNHPVEAYFYSPNKADCVGERMSSTCELLATFLGSDLDQLIASSSQLKQYKSKSSISSLDTLPPVDTRSPASSEEPPGVFGLATNTITSNIVPFTALALLLLVVIGHKHIVRLVLPSKSHQRPSQRQRSEPAGFQTQGFNQIFNPSLESSSEINRQLLPLIRKIDQIAARLDTLETELTAISQRSQPSVSFTKPQTPQTPRLSQPVIENSARKSRPALDVDLIKLAVATSDYELIKPFPHHFVTETFESRQGKEDGLRFSIDGNQDQYDQRSQSEFIAIPYLNETYLIPNLLPNATDPARTIRRFVERNKLYRGTGDNLLSITELATVIRSGDSYALLTSGRVG